MIAGMLEVLELSFNVPSNDENKLPLKATTIEVASQLLILPTPPPVQMHTTALLAALHSSKQAYHLHKVNFTKYKYLFYYYYCCHCVCYYYLGSCIAIACIGIVEIYERT